MSTIISLTRSRASERRRSCTHCTNHCGRLSSRLVKPSIEREIRCERSSTNSESPRRRRGATSTPTSPLGIQRMSLRTSRRQRTSSKSSKPSLTRRRRRSVSCPSVCPVATKSGSFKKRTIGRAPTGASIRMERLKRHAAKSAARQGPSAPVTRVEQKRAQKHASIALTARRKPVAASDSPPDLGDASRRAIRPSSVYATPQPIARAVDVASSPVPEQLPSVIPCAFPSTALPAMVAATA